jgi:hypothetical protein
VTPVDILRWLYERTEPFVRLSEIERSLRQTVGHKLAPDEIVTCARRALSSKYKDRLDAIPVELDAMTLDELSSRASARPTSPPQARTIARSRVDARATLA